MFGNSFCDCGMSYAEEPHPVPNIGRCDAYSIYNVVHGYKLKVFFKKVLKYSLTLYVICLIPTFALYECFPHLNCCSKVLKGLASKISHVYCSSWKKIQGIMNFQVLRICFSYLWPSVFKILSFIHFYFTKINNLF